MLPLAETVDDSHIAPTSTHTIQDIMFSNIEDAIAASPPWDERRAKLLAAQEAMKNERKKKANGASLGWYYRNKERSARRMRKWREDNREHHSKVSLRWHHANRDHVRQRQRQYMYATKFGITVEGFDGMVADQNSRCAICDTSEPGGKWKRWAVDHCHKSGGVRGRLCKNCNVGLGHFSDNVETLKRAIAYLEKHSARPT